MEETMSKEEELNTYIVIDDDVTTKPYPIEQINLARESLKNEFRDAPCRCRAEFFLKLKLGIINDEIVEFFKF